VLYDIGIKVWNNQPVNNSVGHFNVIWQGDANCYALRSLELCFSPAVPLNIAGTDVVSLKKIAESFGGIMGRKVSYSGADRDKCYLCNAAKSFDLFGLPHVQVEHMIKWQADWIMQAGKSLGKPTHFEVSDGKY